MKMVWEGLAILFLAGGKMSADVSKDDLKELLRIGVTEPDIRRYVETHRPLLQLSAEDLADLKWAGASDALLLFLVTPAGVPAVPPVAQPPDPSTPTPELPEGAGTPDYSSAYSSSYPYPYSYPYYDYAYSWYPWAVWLPALIVPFHRHFFPNHPSPSFHRIPPSQFSKPPRLQSWSPAPPLRHPQPQHHQQAPVHPAVPRGAWGGGSSGGHGGGTHR